jgi:glutamate 5-kinase
VGDNDSLAALVAGLVDADLLILLSDIDGLYTADPTTSPDAEMIRVVAQIDSRIEALAGGSKRGWGTGGMLTKIEAARLCTRSQIPMVIANGRAAGVIADAFAGRVGTRFEPQSVSRSMRARKRWIAGGQRPRGTLHLHPAACAQIVTNGSSLLPAGVLEVDGEFAAGDLVIMVDPDGAPVARGIVNYDDATLRTIQGLRTSQVKDTLGSASVDEIVHRDNMVV